MMPADCPNLGYQVQLDLTVAAAGPPPAFSFQPTDPTDPNASHLLNSKGDLDFSDTTKQVLVIINLKDQTGLGLQFAMNADYQVLAFAKDYGSGAKTPVDGKHYQIRRVTLENGGTTVSFCYRNTKHDDDNPHLHHARSEYGVYLIDANQKIWTIDPGVGNGGNS